MCGQIAREIQNDTLTHTAWGAYQIRRKVMPRYQIIEGQYNYVIEADNYADALQMVADWDKEAFNE